jgi:hypothetical protein
MAGTSRFWHQPQIEPKRKFRWIAEIGSSKNIHSYTVKKVGKPEWTTTPKEHKMLGHTFHYPGPVTWNQLELVLVDIADIGAYGPGEGAGDNNTLFMQDLITAAGYAYPEGLGAAQIGVTKERATRALGSLRVHQLNADSLILETFKYHNPWIEKIALGDFDYESEDMVDITLTIRYDFARIIPGDGNKKYRGLGYDEKAKDQKDAALKIGN